MSERVINLVAKLESLCGTRIYFYTQYKIGNKSYYIRKYADRLAPQLISKDNVCFFDCYEDAAHDAETLLRYSDDLVSIPLGKPRMELIREDSAYFAEAA